MEAAVSVLEGPRERGEASARALLPLAVPLLLLLLLLPLGLARMLAMVAGEKGPSVSK